MRSLTITRRKSIIACAAKDMIYIKDENAPELTISGVPCRKLGVLKNGQSATFQIGEGEQQIFVILGKSGRNRNNISVTLPAGQEDIALSGEHKYDYVTNLFRFDPHPFPENTAQQSKFIRKQWIIYASIAAGLILVGAILRGAFSGPNKPSPKTFTQGAHSITLTTDFEQTQQDGFYTAYTSSSAAVFVVREDPSMIKGITLEEYAELMLIYSDMTDLEWTKKGDQLQLSYTQNVDGRDFYYLTVCCEGDGTIWITHLSALAMSNQIIENDFPIWAESIQIADQ